MYLSSIFDGNGQRYSLDCEKIGDLALLNTAVKETLTDAVNEVDGRIPRAENGDDGAFVRVENGQLTYQQLTDVSEVGA